MEDNLENFVKNGTVTPEGKAILKPVLEKAIGMMSGITGYHKREDVDCCGGIFRIYYPNSTRYEYSNNDDDEYRRDGYGFAEGDIWESDMQRLSKLFDEYYKQGISISVDGAKEKVSVYVNFTNCLPYPSDMFIW
jgi:hypothetical protein